MYSGINRLFFAKRPIDQEPEHIPTKSAARIRPKGFKGLHPLLNMPIAARLALGFLLPALLAAITLSSVGIQSQQRLAQQSTFYQNLLDAYSSLSTASGILQNIHTNVQGALNYASQPNPQVAILQDDHVEGQKLAAQFNTIFATYLQQDLIEHYPDIVAIFTEAGREAQITAQATYSEGVQASWQAYYSTEEQVLNAILSGNMMQARILVSVQENTAFADVERDLHSLIVFNGGLVPSLHDAAKIEVNKLLITTTLAVLGVLLGIGLAGWLVSSTLVRRLRRLRSVVQAIAKGQVDARLETDGRDEISDVCKATNIMVDTLVGLIEETKWQRDELAKGEELKRLHEALQSEQGALKEANTRLATLATIDQLTNLPNHRALLDQLDREIDRSRRYDHAFSLLFFDGDHFKRVNDNYGHAIGDVVLQELGERARSVLRAGDTVGRFGGEEFLVLLPETSTEEAYAVAERLRGAVAASPLAAHEVEGGIAVTVSIGVASFPLDGATASELREQADQAMYWAKRLGRNQVRTAAEAVVANHDAQLKAATAQALERQELVALDEQDQASLVRATQLGLIYSLMAALDRRDPGISQHAHEVGDLVAAMARQLQLDEKRTQCAATAAFLHDIGKIALPDRLLHQPKESFSPQEWSFLHQHASIGADIIESSSWLSDLAPAIRHHHEHWDGTGGPDGLAGEAIPLEARMIAVAEAYDAMVNNQPYQSARSASEAMAELERNAGSQFDPALLPVFQAVLEKRCEGTKTPLVQKKLDLLRMS